MPKEEISREKLSNWVTNYIQNFEGCKGCQATVKYKLREPDEEGCNWSSSISVSHCEDSDSDTLKFALTEAVKIARKKFLVL